MEISKGWLETILDKNWEEKRVARVLDVKTETVVNKGDNYASELTRVIMDVILGSGKKTTKSVILKCIPETELRAMFLNQWGVFRKETKMYKEVLPCMEQLLMEIGDRSEPLWCECLDYTPYTKLVLEDLKEFGYVMANKWKGLNLDHATLVMRSLGKFHAMSVILKERGLLDPREFKNFLASGEIEKFQAFHDNCIGSLIEVINTTWEPQFKTYAEKLKPLLGNTSKKMLKVLEQDDSQFQVLSHGDCWVNNMVFKYENDSEVPFSVRFIDFQMSSFNSPAADLQYFLSTSVQVDVRANHTGKLLEAYHSSLASWLKRLGHSGVGPTLEEVNRWVDETALFGLIICMMSLTFMLAEPENAPDLEEFIKDMEENKFKSDYRPYLGTVYTERVKYALKDSIEKGII